MTLEQIRIFVAVAERAHLTRAAEALHLSPSAVSTAIRTLEDRYGAKLFARVGRHIELTETARLLLPEARATLAAAAAAERVLSETGTMPGGRLSLGASQTVGAYWLPDMLVQFHARYPAVELALTLGNTSSVAMAVREGEAELGFIEGEIDVPELGSRPIAMDELKIVVAPGHPWATTPPTRGALRTGRWLLREAGSGTRSAFEAALAVENIRADSLDVAMTLPSNEAILTALQAGTMAGAVSALVAETAIAAGRLVAVKVALRPRVFRVLWHKQRYRGRAALALDALLPMVQPGRRGTRVGAAA